MSATGNILFNMAVTGSQDAAKQFNGVNKSIVGLTAAFAALSAKVAKDGLNAFSKYEAAMRNVQSVTLDNTKAFQDMDKAVLALTNKGLRSYAHETASALYDVRSAGISAGESMATLDMILKTSAATLTDQSAIAKIVTGTMNAYGSEVVNAEKISNLFVKTIQSGVTTGAEMAASFGQVVKIGASAGVEIEELTGSVALLTANFIKTPEAVTGLKAAINALAAPTEGQIKAAKELNIELGAEALKRDKLVGMMAKIGKATNGNIELMKKLIPSTTGLTAALVLADNAGKDFAESVDGMKNSGDALEESLKRQEASFLANVMSMNQGFDLMSIEVGRLVADAVLPLVKGITSLIQGFNNLHPATKQVLITTGLISGALAGITTAVIAFKAVGLTAAIQAASVAAGGFGALLTGTVLPAIIAVTAPAAALASAIWLVVEAMKAKQDAEDADNANTQVIKNYESHRKAISALEDKENLNVKQKKRLALAYRSLANEMKKGTNAHTVYVAKYKSMLASISEADKEAAKEKKKIAKAGGVIVPAVGASTGDNGESARLAKLEQEKNNRIRLWEQEEQEKNKISMTAFAYSEYQLKVSYDKKVKEHLKAEIEIETITKTYQKQKANLLKDEINRRKQARKVKEDKIKKDNDKEIADQDKKEQEITDNYFKALRAREEALKKKRERALADTASQAISVVGSFTNISSDMKAIGQSTAADLMTGTFDPITLALKVVGAQLADMGKEARKTMDRTAKYGVKSGKDQMIILADWIDTINPASFALRAFGVKTGSKELLEGEKESITKAYTDFAKELDGQVEKFYDKEYDDFLETIGKIEKANAKWRADRKQQNEDIAKANLKLVNNTQKSIQDGFKKQFKLQDELHDKKVKYHKDNLKNIQSELKSEQEKARAVKDLIEGRFKSSEEKQMIAKQFKGAVSGFQDGGLFRKSERLAEAGFASTAGKISEGEEFGGLSFEEVQKQRKRLAVEQFAYYQYALKTTRDEEKREEVKEKMRDAQRLYQQNAIDKDLRLAQKEDIASDKKIKRLKAEEQIEGWLVEKAENEQAQAKKQQSKSGGVAQRVAESQAFAVSNLLSGFGIGGRLPADKNTGGLRVGTTFDKPSMGSNPLGSSNTSSSNTSNNSVSVNFSGAINASHQNEVDRMAAKLSSVVAQQLRRQM